jgi:hypothetical protein
MIVRRSSAGCSFMAYRAQISTTQDLLSEAGIVESGPVVYNHGRLYR